MEPTQPAQQPPSPAPNNPAPQPTAPAPTGQMQQPPKQGGNNMIIKVVVIFLAVFIVAGVIWYIFQRSSSYNQYVAPAVSPTVLPTKVAPTSTPLDEVQQVEEIEVGSADAELKTVQQDMQGL